jgi:glycosyltransferase involved in cell wall biosynthesis
MTWHLLTGEFPPDCGGVGDYVLDLARALADAGDSVHVWTTGGRDERTVRAIEAGHPRITIHALPDRFGPASRRTLGDAWRATPGTVLLQYVPNALGARGANLPFCWWLRGVHRAGADVRVMFHEPYFYFTLSRPWRNALALVQRAMAATLLRASGAIYLSTETWRRYLRAADSAARVATLPIPSSIPSGRPGDDSAALRRVLAPGAEPVVGHFGTYGEHVAAELLSLLPAIAARSPSARFAFVGAGSREFLDRLRGRLPGIAERAWASGRANPADVSALLRACDLLIQPYPDGITTRRTSAMAGLKNAVATVSTLGPLTEPIWTESCAVALAPVGDAALFARTVARLLDDAAARQALAAGGARAYERHFSMPRTIATLRAAARVA